MDAINYPIIDADAHVIESDDTWDFLEPAEAKYRPTLIDDPDNPSVSYWQVNGQRGPMALQVESEDDLESRAQLSKRRTGTPRESRRMQDPTKRVAHMDDLGIDVQVLHATMWLLNLTSEPDGEAALARSWNKWLAATTQASSDRLRWSCLVPSSMPDEAINQMRWSKEHGACAVFLRPMEGEKWVTDPAFYPILAEAEALNLAIAIHIANANPANVSMYDNLAAGGQTKARFLMDWEGPATRDYIAAAQTRGEGPWYIMLVEILPNARGPLIVDFCLRMGYTTITIGALGFLGLGLPPPDPDWGGMINETRAMALAFPHMTVFPCLAISSLVLGFNLLADGLREGRSG